MNTNTVTLIGNLVDAPEITVTQSAAARARFRLAHTDRRRDPSTETWQDGDSLFIDVICWRRLAENAGNSLQKGDRVIVHGRLRQWTAERDGVRRVVTEVEAEAVGPDLQRGLVVIARPRRPWAAGEDAAAAASSGPAADGSDDDGDGRGIDGGGTVPEPEAAAGAEPEWERPLVEVGG